MVNHHSKLGAKAAGMAGKAGFDAERMLNVAPVDPHRFGLAVDLSADRHF
jgi:hypothetical protein